MTQEAYDLGAFGLGTDVEAVQSGVPVSRAAAPANALYQGDQPGGALIYYKMRGRDITCPVQPAYVYWTVTRSADFAAAQLDVNDLPCGSDVSTDVADITVALKWTG